MDPLTEKLKGAINLDDEESILSIDGEGSGSADTDGSPCLLARVLSRKPVYLSTFQKQMRVHWDGRFPVQITESEPELFLICFGCEGDRARVLAQEPWHFQNHHIVLQQPKALQSVSVSDIRFSPFWVQIFRLPFLSKTRGLAKAIGDILGDFVEVYDDSLNEGWGPFLRIRVILDVTKPLRRGRFIRLQQSRDKFWVEFRYERLPEWCMECGCLGHPYQKCSVFLELLDNGIEPELAYGPEIKGAALPNSSYDRYRTDFSKGNAWPLLTRLARNTITNSLPSMPFRSQPQPKSLLYGESSDHSIPPLHCSSIKASVCANKNQHESLIITEPCTHTTLPVPGAIHNTKMPSPSMLDGECHDPKSYSLSMAATMKPLAPTPTENLHADVSDLSSIFMPTSGLAMGYNATYPPDSRQSHITPQSTFQHTSFPVMSDSLRCSSAVVPTGKENQTPNRVSKRLPESSSLRKTLKRCRVPNLTHSVSELSTGSETDQHVSVSNADHACSLDNHAEAAIQPRTQP